MSTTLQSANEIRASKTAESPEPSDEELLLRFVSSVHPKADQEAQIYYCGEHMSYAQAVQREKADFLLRARTALAKNREAQEQALAAAAQRAHDEEAFRQNAARGHYRKELALALEEYQKALAIVAETNQALAESRAERKKLESDVTTPVEKLQGQLARSSDQFTVFSTRLTAHQDQAGAQKTLLTAAVKDAQGELIMRWQSAREPLLKKVVQAIRTLFNLSDSDVKDVAGHSYLLYGLDYAAGFPKGYVQGSVSWPYTDDPLVLAGDVDRRLAALESYLASPTHSNLLEVINRVSATK